MDFYIVINKNTYMINYKISNNLYKNKMKKITDLILYVYKNINYVQLNFKNILIINTII